MNIDGRFWFWLLTAITFFALVYLLSPILMPFLVGGLLAYLCDPLADRLEARKLSRTMAVVIVFSGFSLLLLLLLLLLVPLLESQITRFLAVWPEYLQRTADTVDPVLKSSFGLDASFLQLDTLRDLISSHWKETGGLLRSTITALSKSGVAVLGWVANLALIPVIMFYLLRDWDRLVAYLRDLLPRQIEPVVSALAHESDEMLGAFLRGQVMVMLALSILYSTGLWLAGLDFALLIGIIAGLVSFVPYLGLITGVSIAGLAVLFQTQDPFQFLWVFAVFGVAQAIEGSILTPTLVGERIGLHPVTVIFAVLAGGQLFGFFGILVALPVAAVLAVILRHLHDSYKQSQIYSLQAPEAATDSNEDETP
ncbi:MAG TPA: AI-2E family transporter [Thiolinea sp.]|nr:AI-2E family transporter [Thiolinea sp.]